ncbi:MAG: hypothetical protein IPJ88_02925 [Myxococcales bacterium]|nr:MAG: hypothetical protein IPJ88_02925 [Myxococcales bacterium]
MNNFYQNAAQFPDNLVEMCSGFEESNVDSLWGLPQLTTATQINIEDGLNYSFRADHSVYVRKSAGFGDAQLVATYANPLYVDAPTNTINLRFFVYFAGLSSYGGSHPLVHLKYGDTRIGVGPSRTLEPVVFLSVGEKSTSAVAQARGITLSGDTYNGLELQINASEQTLSLWKDGLCLDAFKGPTLDSPQNVTVEFGVLEPMDIGPAEGQLFYLDEIAVDAEPIGFVTFAGR